MKKWELINFIEVPDCFKKLNEGYIDSVVKNGREYIPGIKIKTMKADELRLNMAARTMLKTLKSILAEIKDRPDGSGKITMYNRGVNGEYTPAAKLVQKSMIHGIEETINKAEGR